MSEAAPYLSNSFVSPPAAECYHDRFDRDKISISRYASCACEHICVCVRVNEWYAFGAHKYLNITYTAAWHAIVMFVMIRTLECKRLSVELARSFRNVSYAAATNTHLGPKLCASVMRICRIQWYFGLIVILHTHTRSYTRRYVIEIHLKDVDKLSCRSVLNIHNYFWVTVCGFRAASTILTMLCL